MHLNPPGELNVRNENEHVDISSKKVARDLYASEKQRPGIHKLGRRSLSQIIIPNRRYKRDGNHKDKTGTVPDLSY